MSSDSSDRPFLLHGLGCVLQSRYELLGHLEDLDDAVTRCDEAVALIPGDSSDRPMLLQGLGRALLRRYECMGRLEDLERAVTHCGEVVASTPVGSPDRPIRLHALGGVYICRYRRLRRQEDLEHGIACREEALAVTPVDSPDRPMFSNGLASALISQYERLGRMEDLDRAVTCRDEAVALTPVDSPDLLIYLHNLGGVLLRRHELMANPKDLERSIELRARAVALAKVDSPSRPVLLYGLANAFLRRHKWLQNREDLKHAYVSYEQACTGPCALAFVACDAPLAWLRSAVEHELWTEAVEAARHGQTALRQRLEMLALRTDKSEWLSVVKDLGVLSAYAISKAGTERACHDAVLALEESRAVVLTDTLQSREVVLDELADCHRSLAARYRSASARVAGTDWTADKDLLSIPVCLLTESSRARQELKEALASIRRLPGYERFLTPPVWADIAAVLQRLPDSGCLVYVAATAVGSLALIVCRNEDIEPVWLEFKPGDAERPASGADVSGLLSVLGDRLMGKVAEALLERRITEVTLIPCGALGALPLHAAYCEAGRHGAFHFMDRFTVRYAPNARSVGEAIVEKRRRAGNTMLLGLGNPLPVEQPLAFARCEMEEIERRFKRRYPAQAHQVFYERAARKDGIQDSLARCGCFHHAGHAEFDAADPLASKLVLGDGASLSLRELMYGDYRPKSARLVVLSACRSAETDAAGVPDEFLGLPAGFLQAGVPGVIGTFWPVNDLSTLLVMDRFYELHLAADMEPAVALQAAQRWLRDATCADLVEFYASHPAIDTARRETPGAGQRGAAAGGTFGAAPWYLPELQAPGLRPFRDRPEHWAGFVYVGV